MRYLTVKRNDSSIDHKLTANVYIEDSSANNAFINGTPCRFLGFIANGEEKIFRIEDMPAKVYITCSKELYLSLSEYFQLPGGMINFRLSGRFETNFNGGTEFKFSGITDEPALKSRRPATKKRTAMLVIPLALILAFVIAAAVIIMKSSEVPLPEGDSDYKTEMNGGNGGNGGKQTTANKNAKEFSDPPITITLTKDFSKIATSNYSTFSSDCITIYCNPFTYNVIGDSYYSEDIELFINDYCEEYNIYEAAYLTEGGLDFIQFYAYDENDVLNLRCIFFYKTDEAIWTIDFFTPEETEDKLIPYVVNWAGSVKFS